MKRFTLIVGLASAVLAAGNAVAGPPITLDSLLKEMTDRDALARFPDPAYTCKQASSYDRASTAPEKAETWFANGDVNQYMRVEVNAGRKEWVMMDSAGPGAVVRIWSANPKGNMRVYLDGAETPAIEAPMAEILGGKWKAPTPLSYEASRGWNLYLPIPYATRCKITSDSDGFYYQVNYRTYAPGTAVESFTGPSLDAAAATLKNTVEAMLKDRKEGMPEFSKEEAALAEAKKVGPGEKLVLTLPAGGNAVTGMMLSIKGGDEAQNLRSCVVEATFDGVRTVWCPAGDFFGTGIGINPYQDWYRAVGASGTMRCRWVMPYQKAGRITVENLGKETVEIDLKARVKPWTWDGRSMHFNAVWRQEYPVHAYGGRGTSDFNYVDVKGRGVYVGDVLSIMNPVKEWWGEGDEKIYVDGEKFPSHFGTGTEDYYGYAWCWPDVFERPFHAQSRCDGQALRNNWGRTTVTRSRALDAIPFTTALSMNIEVWHWRECDVEYATTAYFYGAPDATTNRTPMPDSAARKLVEAPPLPPPYKVKDALECEKLQVIAKSEGIEVVPQGGFGPDLWSGGEQLWGQAQKPGDFVEIKVPAPGAGKFTLAVHATRSWDYGIVRFSVNGKKAGGDLDLFNGGGRDVKRTGAIDLGVFEAKDGGFVLRCEVVGGNAKSEGTKSFFGLDCVVVEPVK